MTWSEGDICEKLFSYISGNLCLVPCFYFIIDFLSLVYSVDSMIGNDQSLSTLF